MNLLKTMFPRGRTPRPVLTGLLRGIRLDLDLHAGEIQLWAGLYERETFGAIRRLTRGCTAAIDVGAARGDLVVFLLRQTGMQRVVAVEPEPRELAGLCRTLKLNGLAEDSRLTLHAGYAGRGEAPHWRSLNELAASLPAPLFLKIDIDGPEATVLADAGELLQHRDCRLLIETHSAAAEAACADQLSAAGYTVWIIPNAWWRVFLPEFRPIPHNRWLAATRNP